MTEHEEKEVEMEKLLVPTKKAVQPAPFDTSKLTKYDYTDDEDVYVWNIGQEGCDDEKLLAHRENLQNFYSERYI